MSPPGGGVNAGQGQPALSDADFAALARLVREDSGIHLPPSKRGLVLSRLSKRLRALGLEDFGAYCRHLKTPSGAEERGRLISALTTNVTRFFREDHHFAVLREKVLPPLLENATRGRRVRLWSAGCSSGEEPYSIAITILDLMPDAARHDIRVLATDIDPQVVATARAGVYPATALEPLTPEQRRRYFVPEGTGGGPGSMAVAAAPRGLITFGVLNLIGEWPFRGPFDVIFCRNVVIYFDAATQERLWRRYADLLCAEGHLFIGHSERLSRSAEPLFASQGVTHYRKRPAGAAAGASPPRRDGTADITETGT